MQGLGRLLHALIGLAAVARGRGGGGGGRGRAGAAGGQRIGGAIHGVGVGGGRARVGEGLARAGLGLRHGGRQGALRGSRIRARAPQRLLLARQAREGERRRRELRPRGRGGRGLAELGVGGFESGLGRDRPGQRVVEGVGDVVAEILGELARGDAGLGELAIHRSGDLLRRLGDGLLAHALLDARAQRGIEGLPAGARERARARAVLRGDARARRRPAPPPPGPAQSRVPPGPRARARCGP